MIQLEKRFYSREELAAIAGLDIHGHNFATTAKNTLTKWGYKYEVSSHKGFLITKVPETPLERLTEIMRRELCFNTQVNPYDFACFVYALLRIKGFNAMPWEKREKVFKAHFNIKVTARTMQSWRNKLCETDTAIIFKKNALWNSSISEGDEKVQVPAVFDSKIYKEYSQKRSHLLVELAKEYPQDQVWGEMVHRLYKEYGNYYFCDEICLNAFRPVTFEIMGIIEELFPNDND